MLHCFRQEVLDGIQRQLTPGSGEELVESMFGPGDFQQYGAIPRRAQFAVEVARELGFDHVVAGAVDEQGRRLRPIGVRDGRGRAVLLGHLGGRTAEVSFEDFFYVQRVGYGRFVMAAKEVGGSVESDHRCKSHGPAFVRREQRQLAARGAPAKRDTVWVEVVRSSVREKKSDGFANILDLRRIAPLRSVPVVDSENRVPSRGQPLMEADIVGRRSPLPRAAIDVDQGGMDAVARRAVMQDVERRSLRLDRAAFDAEESVGPAKRWTAGRGRKFRGEAKRDAAELD
jgi:hypothetical protein